MSLTNSEGTPFTMPVAPVGASNNGNGGWGGDALIALIMMFLFPMIYGGMDWGGMGMMGGMGMWPWMFGSFGNFGGNCGCSNPATQADVQRAVDQQTLISKIDQQTYGISQATYDINNTLQNGFSSAELSRCNQQAALMQMLYQMSSNQQNCYCETREAIQGVNYNLATQACDTRNTIQNATCDYVCHRVGSGIIALRGITNQCRTRYRVSADVNIAIATGGTAGSISVALAVNGEALNSATATVTPAAMEEYFNVFSSAYIDVDRGCCVSLSVKNISTQAINVANPNLIVERVG